MKLSGAAAIVTGGGSGLGRATAEALAAKGAKVAVFDLNPAAAEEAAKAVEASPSSATLPTKRRPARRSRKPPRRMGPRGCSSIAPASAWPNASSAATGLTRCKTSSG